jgi:hypothetical protein
MKRLGLVPWLGTIVVLTGLQLAALGGMLPVLGDAGAAYAPVPVWLALLVAVVLQVVKVPVNVARLRDVGRAPDDTVLTIIPLVSIGLFVSLLQRTPPPSARRSYSGRWTGRMLAHNVLARGARTLLAGAAVALPVCIAYGAAIGLAEALVPASLASFLGQPLESRTVAFQVVVGVAAVLGLWLLLQVVNRKKASRASWLPTLAILPLLLLAFALWPPVLELFGLIVPPAFGYAAFGLMWWLFAGGVAGTLWISLAVDLQDHGTLDLRRALAWWRPRLLGALAVHGGVVTVIFVGLQVLWVPGIIYATIMAFAVHAAMLHPELRALRRSGQLTAGRGRGVFNVLALGYVVMVVAQLLTMVGVEFLASLAGLSDFVDADGSFAVGRVLFSWGYAQVFAGAVKLPPVGVGAGAAVAAFVWGSVTAGLTYMYRERSAKHDRRVAKAAAARAAAADARADGQA